MNSLYKTFLLLPLFLISTLTPSQAVQSTLPGLSVSGTQIVADGKPVRLRGVNMGDPFWARNPDWYNYSIADYDLLSEEWRANVVRISVFPTQWKNMDHDILFSGLAQEINAAINNGMYVILSYHVIGWPDGYYKEAYPGNPEDTYDSSMAVATSFWIAMAQTYGSDTRIIFDLWNEPVHPDDFTLYGSDPNPLWPILKGYYETLIQTVRSQGAQNIVIATGNRWASWLVGIKDDPLTDPRVVYAYHQYSVEGSNTPTEWDKNTGGLVGLKPVIVSEWGYEDTDVANPTWPGSEASYGDAFTQWLEMYQLSNLAWMYHYDWTPALFKSDGTLTLFGTFVKEYISSLNSIQLTVPPLDPSLVSFQEVTPGLSSPVFITNAGDGSGRLFVVERTGRIRLIKDGTLQATPFLDIHTMIKSTGGEQGLLALAFHPDYETNGEFYVAYTAPKAGDSVGSNLVLQRFSVSANNTDQADPNSGEIVLTIGHPGHSNHNGGTLAFGADGYLYWSTGDGGGGGDPDDNAQDLNSLLGKILRLNVDAGSTYMIPTSNPFYSNPDTNIRKEIWAYGLRNPWRLSFDRITHDLYIGDVGQQDREEIDFQPANSQGGENYGWDIMEGSICYNADTCDQSGKILPVAEYNHSLGCSVTGGYVYRGADFPSLYGRYFYADYCSGRLFSTYNNLPTGWESPVQLADTAFNISTFGEDENGELYLADLATGKIYRIVYQETFYTISGNVGVGGVQLNYVDGAAQTVTSQADGSYSLQVTAGWSGTVTPVLRCYAFDPPSLDYSNVTTHQTGQDFSGSFETGCLNTNVTIGGGPMGSYSIPPNDDLRLNYAGVDNGPVKVESTNGVPIVSSLRDLWWNGSAYTSSIQLMGLPESQLSDTYYFPSYNNVTLNDQLRFGNVGNAPTTVTVTIGGQFMGSYDLDPNQRHKVNYAGIDNGPVIVHSSGGVPIIASLRDAWISGGVTSSFSQLMGLPQEQLSDTYYFPSYNNVTLNDQLRFGNVGNAATTVTITIGGMVMGSYDLAPNQREKVNYAGIDNGPVIVHSSNGVPIIASLREAWINGGVTTSYFQMMGLPQEQLSDKYVFPAYDNVSLNGQLRFGNVGTQATTVTVTIAGNVVGSYDLAPNQRHKISYALDDGPVIVQSSNGVPIIASLRDAWSNGGVTTSFSQLMGLPQELLSSVFIFPSYNNITYDNQLRIAVP